MTSTEQITELLRSHDRAALADALTTGRIDALRQAGADLSALDELIDDLAEGTYDLTVTEVAVEIAPHLDPADRVRRSRLEDVVTASRVAFPALDDQDTQAEYLDTHTRALLHGNP